MICHGFAVDARLSPRSPTRWPSQAVHMVPVLYDPHVPGPYLGALRSGVYGLRGSTAFMSMNEKMHMDAHWAVFRGAW